MTKLFITPGGTLINPDNVCKVSINMQMGLFVVTWYFADSLNHETSFHRTEEAHELRDQYVQHCDDIK